MSSTRRHGRRTRVFVNRAQELDQLRSALRRVVEDPAACIVICVHGLGGTGKTHLVDEFVERLGRRRRHIRFGRVCLDHSAPGSPSRPLRMLRRHFPKPCHLFDTAAQLYDSDMGRPQPHAVAAGGVGIVVQAAEAAGSVVGVPLPLNFARTCWEGLSRHVWRLWNYRSEDFQEIDDYRHRPEQLEHELSRFLVKDMQARRRWHRRPLVLVYERARSQDVAWLSRFMSELSCGLHVVVSREPLDWPAEIDSRQIRDEVPLGALDDVHCRQFVLGHLRAGGRRRGEGDHEGLVEQIVQTSQRHPASLAAIVDESIRLAADGLDGPAHVPKSGRDAVESLIDHRPRGEQQALVALATVGIFDDRLYRFLIRLLHLQVSDLDRDRIFGFTAIEHAGEGRWRMQSLVCDVVHGAGGRADERRQILEAATDHLDSRTLGGDGGDCIVTFFMSCLTAWRRQASVPERAVEVLLRVGYRLHDAGYWNELGRFVDVDADTEPQTHPADFVRAFLGALSTRRIAGTAAGLAQLETLHRNPALPPALRPHVELEKAYMTELLGRYDEVRDMFRRLNEQADPFEPALRLQVRARQYHADMLTMDGHLVAARDLLLEAAEAVEAAPAGDALAAADLWRHRGHAFRFSLLFEEAEEMYVKALGLAAESRSMVEKLQTNLLEVWCWANPAEAQRRAAEFINLHRRRGNKLETAKCHAALAIALSALGEHDAATAKAESALKGSEELGYGGGRAFALQAAAIIEARRGNAEAAYERLARLFRCTHEIDTYRHVHTVTAALLGQPIDERTLSGTQWIYPDEMAERLQSVRDRSVERGSS